MHQPQKLTFLGKGLAVLAVVDHSDGSHVAGVMQPAGSDLIQGILCRQTQQPLRKRNPPEMLGAGYILCSLYGLSQARLFRLHHVSLSNVIDGHVFPVAPGALQAHCCANETSSAGMALFVMVIQCSWQHRWAQAQSGPQ